MNGRQARTEFASGRLSLERLLEVLERQEQTIRRLTAEVERLKERLAQYEPEVRGEPTPSVETAETPAAPYSLEAEEKRRRRQRRRKKKSPGRRPTHLKFADAERIVEIYPPDVRRSACRLVRERAIWRLENGRAKLVGYRVFGVPGGVRSRVFPALRHAANTASRSWWCWPFWSM